MCNRLLLMVYTFILSTIFTINVFAAEEYRLYQKNLGNFSRHKILESFFRGIELSEGRINSEVDEAKKLKNPDETSLDIGIVDEKYSSGIRIFKIYDSKDTVGFVIVSYDTNSNALLTPILIRKKLESSTLDENQIVFSLISTMSEFLESKDKVSIPYSWLLSDRHFKKMVEEHRLSSSFDYMTEEDDTYIVNLEALNLKKLRLKAPYGIEEIPVFSEQGEKILMEIIFSEELSIHYHFDQLRKININYKIVIDILEKIEKLRQLVYTEKNNNFKLKKTPSILNYLKVAAHFDEDDLENFNRMLTEENFNIKFVYEIIKNRYFESSKKYRVQGMSIFVELFPFLNAKQEVELQKLVLRNDEFFSILLWDVDDVRVKTDALIALLWERNGYSQDILLRVFDKYKGVRSLEKGDVKVLLAVLDFVQINNYNICEVREIVNNSYWLDSEDNKKDVKKIKEKLATIMRVNNIKCRKYFSE